MGQNPCVRFELIRSNDPLLAAYKLSTPLISPTATAPLPTDVIVLTSAGAAHLTRGFSISAPRTLGLCVVYVRFMYV